VRQRSGEKRKNFAARTMSDEDKREREREKESRSPRVHAEEKSKRERREREDGERERDESGEGLAPKRASRKAAEQARARVQRYLEHLAINDPAAPSGPPRSPSPDLLELAKEAFRLHTASLQDENQPANQPASRQASQPMDQPASRPERQLVGQPSS